MKVYIVMMSLESCKAKLPPHTTEPSIMRVCATEKIAAKYVEKYSEKKKNDFPDGAHRWIYTVIGYNVDDGLSLACKNCGKDIHVGDKCLIDVELQWAWCGASCLHAHLDAQYGADGWKYILTNDDADDDAAEGPAYYVKDEDGEWVDYHVRYKPLTIDILNQQSNPQK